MRSLRFFKTVFDLGHFCSIVPEFHNAIAMACHVSLLIGSLMLMAEGRQLRGLSWLRISTKSEWLVVMFPFEIDSKLENQRYSPFSDLHESPELLDLAASYFFLLS